MSTQHPGMSAFVEGSARDLLDGGVYRHLRLYRTRMVMQAGRFNDPTRPWTLAKRIFCPSQVMEVLQAQAPDSIFLPQRLLPPVAHLYEHLLIAYGHVGVVRRTIHLVTFTPDREMVVLQRACHGSHWSTPAWSSTTYGPCSDPTRIWHILDSPHAYVPFTRSNEARTPP